MPFSVWDLFQGIGSFFQVDPMSAVVRIVLILLGMILVYLGYKQILDPLIMIPMGIGMAAVNAGILDLGNKVFGTLFVDPLVSDPSAVVNTLQVNFLQPIYTLTFANGLIACLVFMGIGAITDIDFLIAKPMLSMLLAVAAELGTILTLPLAVALGFTVPESAAIATVGGADGPMVLYGSLRLAPHLFVPISVVAYVYLSVTYALYPSMARLLIPRRMRGVVMNPREIPRVSSRQKFMFAVIACVVLCLLFPVAAPLLASFFLGVAVKEANIERFRKFLDDVVLNGASLFLGFVLGTLLSVNVVSDTRVVMIMVLGFVALILSGLGGIVGGLVAAWLSKGKINPLLGIAAVSCVPTTAKVAQKLALEVNKKCFILPFAMGPNVAGVVTTAVITAIYVTLVPVLFK